MTEGFWESAARGLFIAEYPLVERGADRAPRYVDGLILPDEPHGRGKWHDYARLPASGAGMTKRYLEDFAVGRFSRADTSGSPKTKSSPLQGKYDPQPFHLDEAPALIGALEPLNRGRFSLAIGENVCFGSKADIGACPRDVRFTTESGHSPA
jgi:hypothetical protein